MSETPSPYDLQASRRLALKRAAIERDAMRTGFEAENGRLRAELATLRGDLRARIERELRHVDSDHGYQTALDDVLALLGAAQEQP